jgi:DNA-binding NtrC family response regulator
VRELKNIIERIVVLSDKNFWDDQILPGVLGKKSRNTLPVEVNEICPIKDVFDLAERQLLTLAVKKYRTNEEVAKKLKVNQSTISRKLRKHNISFVQ